MQKTLIIGLRAWVVGVAVALAVILISRILARVGMSSAWLSVVRAAPIVFPTVIWLAPTATGNIGENGFFYVAALVGNGIIYAACALVWCAVQSLVRFATKAR